MLYRLKQLLRFFSGEDTGARGEREAATWLKRNKSYAVVARNWRDPRDKRNELDLVCRDRDVLVFVEVKARAAGSLVPGYFAVNERKRRVLRRAADAYLARLRPAPTTFRFDVVEVTFGLARRDIEVLHFENVPLFAKHYHR
jgi:putative endonuclease